MNSHLEKVLAKPDSIKIEILLRDEIEQVSLDQWRQLSNESVYVNPFYEPWCLVPAFRHLDKQKEVYLVTAYENGKLAALFPVILKSSHLGIRYLAIWKHSHCFLSDPLCLESACLSEIVEHVVETLSASIFQIKDHSPLFSNHKIRRPNVVICSTRAAISNTGNVRHHLETLPKKMRAENRRLKRRVVERPDVSYYTSADRLNIDWLETYCKLEHAGWKGRQKGSIYSSPEVSRYYSDVNSEAGKIGRIEFQGLFSGANTLAASFHIISRNRVFELKTSYNENFGDCYPGVVLELMNMEMYDGSNFQSIDSCTSPQNELINRLWPDQRHIWNSFYFSNSLWGRTLKAILGTAFRLRDYRLWKKPGKTQQQRKVYR